MEERETMTGKQIDIREEEEREGFPKELNEGKNREL